ncbi:sensor histidine kinase [Methanoculleus thermophilus]|jgi:PAS domain S-box-containing protein|uniref:histidine kinase n=1 Tax=Methanoculleus thermophilus TaxID=2200 RepID=A0A1G8X739_9EURY|nr:histidine kinase dimerization/phosphoacceptor domain -containing protein [Methanoculleus thermophilus]NLN09147.1 PAS domain-containing protein [Methanoculleus thermophilus]SDJ86224.1 PAS domain S-box-containing protein [Methanoculleus thermophilus]
MAAEKYGGGAICMTSEMLELEEIKKLLRKEPHGLSILEISRKLGIGRNVTAKYMSMLHAAGQVEVRRVAAAKLYTLAHRVPVSALLGLTSDLIVVLDRNLCIVFANTAFCTEFCPGRDEIVGYPIEAFLPDRPIRQQITEMIHAALRGQERRCKLPWEVDGHTMKFHATFIPIVFEDGAPGVTVILEDVTREVEAMQDLRKALEEKDALIHAIHFRMRNALQTVSSIMHLQTSHLTDPAARRAVRATEQQILSLALAHEELHLSQNLSRVRMADYIARLAGTLFRTYNVPPEKIAWKVRAPGVEMPLELAQFTGFILTERIVNVIQHAFPDGMTGSMELAIDRDHTGRYTITVRDTGVGIPEGMEIAAGTTPGLPSVRYLVEQYLGGEISIRGDGGTTVTIAFNGEEPHVPPLGATPAGERT